MRVKGFALSIFLLAIVALPVDTYPMAELPVHKYMPIRVLVFNDVEVVLSVRGHYKMLDYSTGSLIKQGDTLNSLVVDAKLIEGEGMKILTEKNIPIYVNKLQFRGEIDIIKNKNSSGLMVINNIDLEEYLCGVLHKEISHTWPMEALMAQAIVARTYALYRKLTNRGEYFDLTSDVYSQVYGGRSSEQGRTTIAVRSTQGLVLVYDGKVFPSYYHATCGGHTANVSMLWDMKIPTLEGKICEFCKGSPHYKWKKEATIELIQEKLEEARYNINVVSLETAGRDSSERVNEIVIHGGEESVNLKGNRFRLLMGPNFIKSTNFKIKMDGRNVIFEGYGWGHGVGMCQWGAYEMAKKDRKVKDILEYYYPGSEIVLFRD